MCDRLTPCAMCDIGNYTRIGFTLRMRADLDKENEVLVYECRFIRKKPKENEKLLSFGSMPHPLKELARRNIENWNLPERDKAIREFGKQIREENP